MIPKFRAWDKTENQWIEGFKLHFYEDGSILCLDVEDECDFPFFVENIGVTWELMQSTGLKDKNGVEIFEGDILKLDIWQGQEDNYVDLVTHDVVTGRPSKYIKKLGEVKKDMFGGLYVNDFYLLNLEIADKYQYEVIGNIYQNPELLEGELQ